MSTRAQFGIEDGEALVYKHGDGYPSGVFDLLLPFIFTFWKNRGHDAAYFLARLVQRITNALDMDREAFDAKSGTGSGWSAVKVYGFLSCGIDTGYHGDIEWSYFITKDGTLKVYRTALWDAKDADLPKPGEDPEGKAGFTLVQIVKLLKRDRTEEEIEALAAKAVERPTA